MQLVPPCPRKRKFLLVILVLLAPLAIVMAVRAQEQVQRYQEAEALFLRSDHLMDQDRPGEAIPLLQRSVALCPDLYASWDALAVCYLLTHQPEKALDTLKQAQTQMPDRSELYRTEARLELARGRYQQAADAACRAAQLDPTDPLCQGLHQQALQALQSSQSPQGPVDGSEGGQHGDPHKHPE